MATSKASRVAGSGSRTRVTFFLPAQHDRDAMAVRDVLKYLGTQRHASVPVGGYTTSSTYPLVFLGAWYNDQAAEGLPVGWCREGVVQVILDVLADMHEDRVAAAMARWRAQFAKIYKECGSPQAEFWMMAHPIIQYVAQN